MRAQGAQFVPGLRIVQVGGREDSNVYIRMKIKAAQEIGINAVHVQLPRSITEVELLDKVRREINKERIEGTFQGSTSPPFTRPFLSV